jgi:hypothetical protein
MTTLTTTDSTRRLSEVARHLVVPDGIVTSAFPKVYRRLKSVGVSFDQWQIGFGTAALGCRDTGKFAATIGGVAASIPRQVGKTFTVGHILIGMCLEFPGLRVAWTSHHNRTTTNTFRSLQGLVRRKAIWPFVAPNGIRTTNGEQEIRFVNGSLIMFGAREQGFGRGLDEIDVEVFDEASILTIKALEDMIPATNQARNPHGGLIFFLGTPPRPNDPGEAFTLKREQALSGSSTDIMFVEISAEEGADPDDQSQYPLMNPSFPHRTPLEAILRMRANIPDEDSFRREAMGIWPAVSVHQPIVSAAQWRSMADVGPSADVRPAALGLDMSHGRDISVGACWIEGDNAHIEQVWGGDNPSAAVEWIAAQAGRKTTVVVDGASPAASLVPELKAHRCKVVVTSAGQMAQACGILENRIATETLTHGSQPELTEAILGAKRRPIRDAGGWGLDRRDPTVVIHAAVAATLALFGASLTTRPSRDSSSTGRRAVLL